MEQTKDSEAQEFFIQTCATWLNVIGQLSKTTDANKWTTNFCWHLERYIKDGIASIQAGEVPGDQLEAFCDTDVWRDLAIAVAMESTEKDETEFALRAVRALHRAYEYHNAEGERRSASWEAHQKALAAARGNGPSSNGCGGEVTATSA